MKKSEARAHLMPWVAAALGCGFGAVTLMASESWRNWIISAAFFAYSLYSMWRFRKAVDKIFEEDGDAEDGTRDT